MVRSLYVRRDTTYVEQHDPLITGEISRQEPDERLLLDIHRATRCLDGQDLRIMFIGLGSVYLSLQREREEAFQQFLPARVYTIPYSGIWCIRLQLGNRIAARLVNKLCWTIGRASLSLSLYLSISISRVRELIVEFETFD